MWLYACGEEQAHESWGGAGSRVVGRSRLTSRGEEQAHESWGGAGSRVVGRSRLTSRGEEQAHESWGGAGSRVENPFHFVSLVYHADSRCR
ncbi:hypothetical protein ACOMHN_012408 [Nucella lapillus]